MSLLDSREQHCIKAINELINITAMAYGALKINYLSNLGLNQACNVIAVVWPIPRNTPQPGLPRTTSLDKDTMYVMSRG